MGRAVQERFTGKLVQAAIVEEDLQKKPEICDRSCGPPHRPKMLKWLNKPLGSGSTAEVFEWEVSESLTCEQQPAASAQNAWFQVYSDLKPGDRVALKTFDFSKECIGSFSAGVQPRNYPTRFTTSVKEHTVAARITAGKAGPGKENVNLLAAAWLDEKGHYLVYRLVPDAAEVNDVLAPGSSKRSLLCGMPLDQASAVLKQFVLGLDYVSQQGVVHRDGGIANWLISGLGSSKPHVELIDYGLSICTDSPFTEPDDAKHLLGHLCNGEEDMKKGQELDQERMNPIDWLYSPGAAGPKFAPPPELRVVREELPGTAAESLKQKEFPYTSGYDVWVLGWAFMQIILGERWEDWKKDSSDDPFVNHVKAHFYDKNYQVPVPWELGSEPSAWRLAILNGGADHFKQGFLDKFLKLASERILKRGRAHVTPLQAEFLKPESHLRELLLKMWDFDASNRMEYLRSKSLLRDIELLAKHDPVLVEEAHGLALPLEPPQKKVRVA